MSVANAPASSDYNLNPHVASFGQAVKGYIKGPKISKLDLDAIKVRLAVQIDDRAFILDEVVKKTELTPNVRFELAKKLTHPPFDEKVPDVFEKRLRLSCNLFFQASNGQIAWAHVSQNVGENRSSYSHCTMHVYRNLTLSENIQELMKDFEPDMKYFDGFDNKFKVYQEGKLI